MDFVDLNQSLQIFLKCDFSQIFKSSHMLTCVSAPNICCFRSWQKRLQSLMSILFYIMRWSILETIKSEWCMYMTYIQMLLGIRFWKHLPTLTSDPSIVCYDDYLPPKCKYAAQINLIALCVSFSPRRNSIFKRPKLVTHLHTHL